MSRGAIYVERSKNAKLLGSKPVDSTYASIQATCPSSCPLRDEGCYAQTSFVGMINWRLDRRARGGSPLAVAKAEAKCIDSAYGGEAVPAGRFLRLHVSGDSRSIAGSRAINNAVGRWLSRGGKDVWSYTHSWRHVHRNVWSNVSMLASVDSVDQVAVARANGYAPAIVVPEHSGDKVYALPNSDVKWIPCPAQTRNVGCTDCRLCFNANRLYESNMGIAFEVHGVRKNLLKKHLMVVQ